MTASNFDPLALSGCCGTTIEKNVVIEKLQLARSKLRQALYDGVSLEKSDSLLQEVEELLTEVLA